MQIENMKKTAIIVFWTITLSCCKQDIDFHKFNNPIVWENSQTITNNIYDGVEYILKGFEQFDIIAIGESHGIKDVTDFYLELVKNEIFRKQVDAIVFELGNSLYQEDLDNYIFGNNNDTLKIKKLWRDHSSSILQSSDRTGVSRFFREVRKINLTAEHKIRILAAEPPLEWAKIKSSEELFEFLGLRDQFYADLVITEIIDKKKKALLIMGSGHFNKCKPPHHVIDNPISSILRATDKNLVLITTMTIAEFPFDQLPNIKKGELIETINPIVGELKIGSPFLKDYPLKIQTDALLYLGEIKNIEYEVHTPFNDHVYENELNRRKELINIK